jgi:hypothetical protein
VILRPVKTPDGQEVARVLRHLVKAIRARWPRVEIVIRGDSHYARPEAMSCLERNRVRYIFGLAGNRVLPDRTTALAEDAAVRRAEEDADKVRSFHNFRYAARTWKGKERRVIARLEATRQGGDTRFVVTYLSGTPRWLYEVLYCGRGQAENLIKAHKLHLASDRTSCTKATAKQFRLLIHTAAYWLLHTLKGMAPKTSFWRDAQFDTIRLVFIKIAARVTEIVTRIKVSLPCSYPYKQRPDRCHGKDFLQHPRHLRRIRVGPDPAAHPRGHGDRPGEGQAARQEAQAQRAPEPRAAAHVRYRRVQRRRPGRGLLGLSPNHLPHPESPGMRHIGIKKSRQIPINLTGRSTG